jgi:hypothetical protein
VTARDELAMDVLIASAATMALVTTGIFLAPEWPVWLRIVLPLLLSALAWLVVLANAADRRY